MTRKKVKLQLIPNDSERKASFRKRKKGLMKKVHELSVLCDVEACAMVYSPYEIEPAVWPSPANVQHLLERFHGFPEAEKARKMFDQETYTFERIKKLNEQAEKLRKENERKEAEYYIYSCLHERTRLHNFDTNTLNRIRSSINDFVRDIDFRLEMLCVQNPPPPTTLPLPAPATPAEVSPVLQHNTVTIQEIFPDLELKDDVSEMDINDNFKWFTDAIETLMPYSPVSQDESPENFQPLNYYYVDNNEARPSFNNN